MPHSNLDPKSQIRYVDTKHQLADILTKGNFTHDEWNNLLYLFHISHFDSLCCAQNVSLTSCTKTMAKRMQEQEGEERIVAKSKPTMNLAFIVSTSSSTVQNPIAPKGPWILKAPCRKDWSSTGKLVASGYPVIQELQETQETRKPKAMTKIGHTISIFHQIKCRTCRRFSRCETRIWSQSER